jgi:hypothetical protein
MMGKSWQHLWGWGERAPMLTPSLCRERDHLGSGPYLTKEILNFDSLKNPDIIHPKTESVPWLKVRT